MIHRDRGGNCVERRLLALMISVALLGAVLPGLIGRRGAAGCTKSDGYIAPGGDTASAVSSVPGERDADSSAVPTKACAALPMGTRTDDGVPLLGGTVRALWIASAYAIDYPSGDGGCIAELRAEINRIVKMPRIWV